MGTVMLTCMTLIWLSLIVAQLQIRPNPVSAGLGTGICTYCSFPPIAFTQSIIQPTKRMRSESMRLTSHISTVDQQAEETGEVCWTIAWGMDFETFGESSAFREASLMQLA